MAHQRANPRPFIPDGFVWEDVPDRDFMNRAVAPLRPQDNNKDLATALLILFPVTTSTSMLLEISLGSSWLSVGFRTAVLPCHLGQAYVCFTHAYDRDNMVSLSPMPFGNVQISFAKHNEGRNWRRVLFTKECWMMLLDFLEDYKAEWHIQNVVNDFAGVILWEESDNFPGRIMVIA